MLRKAPWHPCQHTSPIFQSSMYSTESVRTYVRYVSTVTSVTSRYLQLPLGTSLLSTFFPTHRQCLIFIIGTPYPAPFLMNHDGQCPNAYTHGTVSSHIAALAIGFLSSNNRGCVSYL